MKPGQQIWSRLSLVSGGLTVTFLPTLAACCCDCLVASVVAEQQWAFHCICDEPVTPGQLWYSVIPPQFQSLSCFFPSSWFLLLGQNYM